MPATYMVSIAAPSETALVLTDASDFLHETENQSVEKTFAYRADQRKTTQIKIGDHVFPASSNSVPKLC